MKNHLKKAFALFAIVGSFALVSCEQDEFEDVVTDPDPVNTDTIVDPVDTTDTVSPGECSGTMALYGPSGNPADTSAIFYINNTQGVVALFNAGCDETASLDSSLNYLVIYSVGQQWGSNGVQVGWSANGIQGIEIASSTPFEVGGTYPVVGDYLGFPSYITIPSGGMLQVIQILNGSVTLTQAGDDQDEPIAGIFTGTAQLTDGSIVTVTGNFCMGIEIEFQ